MAPIVEANSLVKEFRVLNIGQSKLWNFFIQNYKIVKAVEGVSMKIEKGEALGLLGPNGAGKTTLIRLLCGLLQPTSGTALICGRKPEEELQKIGVMLSNLMIYHRITGHSNLKYFARLYQVENIEERIKEVTDFVELDEKWLSNYAEYYSLGMKTKLALARALLHNPEILFLDEPTQGLDPWVSEEVRRKIKGLKKTILLSSHSLQDLEEICDRIAVMRDGKIEKIDSAKGVRKYFKGQI